MSNVKFDEMYKSMNTKELTALAKELGVPRYYTLNKKELVLAILEKQSVSEEHYYASGILDDIHPENGFGFLRTVDYKKGETDIYISASQIRRFELKKGDEANAKVYATPELGLTYKPISGLTLSAKAELPIELKAQKKDFDVAKNLEIKAKGKVAVKYEW